MIDVAQHTAEEKFIWIIIHFYPNLLSRYRYYCLFVDMAGPNIVKQYFGWKMLSPQLITRFNMTLYGQTNVYTLFHVSLTCHLIESKRLQWIYTLYRVSNLKLLKYFEKYTIYTTKWIAVSAAQALFPEAYPKKKFRLGYCKGKHIHSICNSLIRLAELYILISNNVISNNIAFSNIVLYHCLYKL